MANTPPTLTEAQRRRISIWWSMTPEQRDYDRFVARQIPDGLPPGEANRSETGMTPIYDDDDAEYGCSCHLSAPCSSCTSADEEG